MAPNVDDLNQLLLAIGQGDKAQLTKLESSGRIIDWQAQGGKRVAVLDHKLLKALDSIFPVSTVRILEGPQIGQFGWVFDTELKP
jgi:hypothetical protein